MWGGKIIIKCFVGGCLCKLIDSLICFPETHDVGTGGAEGVGPTGVKVGLVQLNEDADEVEAFRLQKEKGGGSQFPFKFCSASPQTHENRYLRSRTEAENGKYAKKKPQIFHLAFQFYHFLNLSFLSVPSGHMKAAFLESKILNLR